MSGGKIQSILFSKSSWSVSEAKKWLKSHGYRYGKVDSSGSYHRFRQFDPIKGGRYATIDLVKSRGVKAVVYYGDVDDEVIFLI